MPESKSPNTPSESRDKAESSAQTSGPSQKPRPDKGNPPKKPAAGKDGGSTKPAPGKQPVRKSSGKKPAPAKKDPVRSGNPARAAKAQAEHRAAEAAGQSQTKKTNAVWFLPVMLGLMILGLAWIVVFYLSGSHQFPIPSLGNWNLAVGFALIIVGFGMTTQWK